ncbi:MAG: alpha/beta hydrolase [Flavobacteriaceae bacterium]|nr:alpha/beta hydrolase [Flavobacteriaceae bacterium]
MKNRNHLFFLLFGISLCLFSCTSEDNATLVNDETAPLVAKTIFNVSYGSNDQQVYDLYLPEGRTVSTTKVIMLIHGGGWTEGDKEDMDNFVSFIQREHPNHAIINVNYVLASVSPPVAAFPNQFLDIESVIQKITLEQESLQILPEFGLIGTSAGAHLALMYDYVYDTDNQVKFVANIVGPTDFTDPFYADNPNFQIALSLLVDESQYPDGTNYAEITSPVYQVSTSSSPAALFYGNQDPLVPLSNGISLDAILTNSQITHSFTTYNGGHGDDWSTTDYLNLQTQISEYIDSYLPYIQ